MVYYSIPIYLIVNGNLIDSHSNPDILKFFQDQIQRLEIFPNTNKFFQLVNSSADLLRTKLAFQLFTNGIVPKSSVLVFQDYLKTAFERSSCKFT